MLKFTFLIATAALIAAFAAGTASSAPGEDCSHNPSSAWNVIISNAEYGFRPYLIGIGTPWWGGKARLASSIAASTTPLCGAAARTAYALQQRFYTLLRAFPAKPTRAQWKARFRPLMQAAIAADADFLTITHSSPATPIDIDKAWLVARQFAPLGSPLLN